MNDSNFVPAPPHYTLIALSTFLAFFLALFAQFPLQNALPGNCDTLVAIAVSNTYFIKIAAFFGSGAAGMTMYPAGSIMYGEEAPAIAMLYVLFKVLSASDITAYYLLLTTIFALTGTAVFVYSGLFIRSFAARMFAAFAVACSNVLFSHIDDAIVWFYFFPLLALYFLTRAFREQNTKLAYLAALLGGVQIYCSMYIFVYQTILLAAMALYHRFWRKEGLPGPVFIKSAVLYTVVAAPLILIYLWVKTHLDISAPWDPRILARGLSMNLTDFFLALPGNLLYGRDTTQTWYVMRHQNLIGLLTFVAAGAALFRKGEHRRVLLGMGLIGLLLALGPDVLKDSTEPEPHYLLPLYPIYEWIPISHYLRVPIRAYFFVLLALSILAGVTLETIGERLGRPRAAAAVALLFFGIHFVENVPFPFHSYKLGPLLEIAPEYKSFMEGKTGKVVLDLPTNFGFAYENWDYELFSHAGEFVYTASGAPKLLSSDITLMDYSEQDLFAYNRDMFYMNWQTEHRQNIIGGVNGYFPTSRLVFDRWAQDLPSEHALLWMRKQGVDYITYNKEMLLPGDNGPDLLEGLEKSPLLRRVVNGERVVIFEYVAGEGL